MNLIIINQIIILGIIVLVGVIAARAKILTEEINQSLSKVVFNITLPFLVFISVSSIKINPELISNSILVFIFAFIVIFFLYGTALISAKIFKLDDGAKVVHAMHTMFGNTIFLGYPLIKSLYGEEGLLYAIIYQLGSDIIMWTFGIYLLNGKKEKNIWVNLKTLINPNTIAFACGLIFMGFGIQIPYIINTSLGSLGQTTVPLSMIFIGGMLAKINIKGVFSHGYVFGMSVNKMIISPILIFLLLFVLNKYMQFKISFIALSVIVMQVATPAMATIVILCRQYNRDDIHATENVYISTVLSLLTLPLIFLFINYIFKLV
jgi:malate permease and related proteins